jgi:hypothetical protein
MINWLESRFGFLAIPRFIRMIAMLNLLVFLLALLQPSYLSLLILDPWKVMEGQVWRLVSYIFIPEVVFQSNAILRIIFLFIYLSFMVWIGDNLEEAWGAFKLNLYYLLGMIGVTASVFLIFFLGKPSTLNELGAIVANISMIPFYVNLSLFLAFATLFPNIEILFMFVLPVKVKWVALFSLIFPVYALITGPLIVKPAILIAFANYCLFFGPTLLSNARTRSQVQKRRQTFAAKSVPEDEPMHRCATCGKTEHDDHDLEFRVTADGREYCTEHLPSS